MYLVWMQRKRQSVSAQHDELWSRTSFYVTECNAGHDTTSPGTFDIILANAVPQTGEHGLHARFAYAQLLLALQNIAVGGALVITLDTQPLDYVVNIIGILNRSFGTMKAASPYRTNGRSVHIVCHGYGGSEGSRRLHNTRIREALRELKNTGQYKPILSIGPCTLRGSLTI